ncbi:peptidoglycan D,D-transpeptidase FtsI family protein [Glaciibacter sp. 2TAF33]|uniref:peptidoglycan D,D-transpeptidase FtsI family protein n=1 Tax=Glaciibacter sp. 2TAF33 TaxID=3233015 RepID=UPI003F8E316D
MHQNGQAKPRRNGSSASGRRRTAASIVVLFVIIAVFVVKLVDIQVVRADTLNAESLGNRSVEDPVYGSRGDILAADGTVLAGAVMRYHVTLSPKNAKGFTRTTADGKKSKVTLAQAAAEIGAVTGQTGDGILGIISKALADNPDSDFAYVVKGVGVDVYRALDKLDIPWLYFKKSPSRVYPNGAVAGNLIGFVSSSGEAQAGLELGQDSCLAGTNGTETYEKGGDGIPIPGSSVVTKQASDGGDVLSTIDSDLQWYAQQTLAAQAQSTGAAWGTAVVQEVKTGKLVAVADYPSVDPNNVNGTDPENRGSRAFTASFEPGSNFKALTAASVVDAGKANPGSEVVAPYRYLPDNGANINDSTQHPDLNLTLTGVLIESSNTGMSKFGERLSDHERYDYMTKFGIGSESEVGFPSEDSGILHPWEDWDPQTKYATMFGQGLTATAIQMASVYQTIANSGVRLPVQLVEGCRQADGTETHQPVAAGRQVISAAAARSTADMLENVYANAWLADKWKIPGYRVASKTSTAQMPDGHGGYSHGYLVSVSGFAPADDPQYVVSVSLADPVNMNTSAAPAPVFQKVMSQVLKKYRAVPSGNPAPVLPANW